MKITAIFPDEALAHHTAVLGKTGSGKTSTAKLLVEQVVVKDDARVCVLDLVKSDWWGITASADGKKPGLPFSILGGPHGHVPIHAGAGKAVAELVATGALRHSIIDMADFEAGGVQRFFVDFAPALLRNMKGVLYLVIEEAHEIAPKERSGFDKENMAIHYAKKLATAGRSKGIRLVVVTQRTQALHNALLGSCENMLAHRLTAPADQKPVLKWLESNTAESIAANISKQLSRLKTGDAWFVSGALQLERLQTFPRIQTYDNTATPTGDEQHQQVKTAPVDLDALAAKIGEAVAEAEANDPKKLKARLAAAEAELAKRKHTAGVTGVDPGTMTKAITTARAEGRLEGRMEMGEAMRPVAVLMEQGAGHVHDAIRMFKAIKLPPIKMQPIFVAVDLAKPGSDRTVARIGTGEGDPTLKGGLRRILIALAQRPGLTRRQIGIRAGVASKGGSFNGHLAKGRAEGWITGSEKMEITPAGLAALGTYEPLPTGRALLDHWLEELGDSGAGKILRVATERYPEALSREAIGEAAGIAASGGSFNGHLSRLRGLELICGERGEIKASEELFQ